MKFPDARILVFCKAPVPGQVKTRLAEDIGEIAAAQFHENLARHCLQNLTDSGVAPVQLWCAPDGNHPFFDECREHFDIEVHEQKGSDLGEKMDNAIDAALSVARHCLVVGTDCPALNGTIVSEAMTALHAGADGVIGPAEDGGYFLVGLSKPTPQLFAGISWGTHQVLAQTRPKMTGHWRELEMLWDIDRADDLRRLKDSVGQWPHARELAVALQAINLHAR